MKLRFGNSPRTSNKFWGWGGGSVTRSAHATDSRQLATIPNVTWRGACAPSCRAAIDYLQGARSTRLPFPPSD